jgi:hypothetical protein
LEPQGGHHCANAELIQYRKKVVAAFVDLLEHISELVLGQLASGDVSLN